jgi:DNA polymerase elongation subunit (family B)
VSCWRGQVLRWADAGPQRILDFDIETLAAGYADPEWVPSNVTAIAWSWVGEDKVETRTVLDYTVDLTDYLWFSFMGCAPMLREFVAVFNEADAVTGHNIGRFDLPVMNAELMRLGLPVLEAKSVIDTIRLKRSKGFKKGQDVLAEVFDVPAEKKAMNWAQWRKAYATPGWPEVRERVSGDVVQHKLVLRRLTELGYLRTS